MLLELHHATIKPCKFMFFSLIKERLFPSNGTTNMPFRHLPTELVLDILLWAAEGDVKTALRVTRVSKDIHRWTIPSIYHSIRLNSSTSILSLNRSIEKNPELSKPVRHLAIFALGPVQAIQQLIYLVPEIISLVAGFPLCHLSRFTHIPEPSAKDVDSPQLPLIREQHFLGMSCRDDLSRVLTPSLIPPSTTHLRLNLPASEPESLYALIDLPGMISNLTHLAFVWRGTDHATLRPILEKLLAKYDNLNVLLLQCNLAVDEWKEHAEKAGDIRLVTEPIPLPVAKLEWESKQDCSSMWIGAETEIGRRRVECERLAPFPFSDA